MFLESIFIYKNSKPLEPIISLVDGYEILHELYNNHCKGQSTSIPNLVNLFSQSFDSIEQALKLFKKLEKGGLLNIQSCQNSGEELLSLTPFTVLTVQSIEKELLRKTVIELAGFSK